MKSKKQHSTVTDGEQKSFRGKFQDTLTVHTARSGTQYVLPAELLYERKELLERIKSLLRARNTERHS
jgi:hypothetical protein